MSFKHIYPSVTHLIGYLSQANKVGEAKGGGPKVRATLHNPSATNSVFDLFVPLIAFGRCGDLVLDGYEGDYLVSVIGRICMVKNPSGTRVEVLCDHVAFLDDENHSTNINEDQNNDREYKNR